MFGLRAGALCVGLLVTGFAPGALAQEVEDEFEDLSLRPDRGWTHLVVRLKSGKVVTFSRGDLQSVTYRSPAPPERRGHGPGAIAGTWGWVQGQTLAIDADGTFDVYEGTRKVNDGRWEMLGGGRYRLMHRQGGYVDTVDLSRDQNSLDGENRSGDRIHGSRLFGPSTHSQWGHSLVGTWDWNDGQVLRVYENGAFDLHEGNRKINEGRWESLGPGQFRLIHRSGGYVDAVSMTQDGRSLGGTNNNGLALRGARR